MPNSTDIIKILLVEDNKTDATIFKATLEQRKVRFDLIVVDSKEDYIDALEKNNFDIIVSDYMLPSFNGMEALVYRNQHNPLLPFIVLTGSLSEETAVSCIKAGADDYIIKDHISRIDIAINKAIERKKLEKEKRDNENELSYEKELYQNLFELSPIGIILEDSKGTILDANGSILKVTGYTKEELIGQNIRIFAPKEDYPRIEKDIKDILNGKIIRQEVTNVNKDGKHKHSTEITETRIRLPDGTMGILSINNDITHRKKVEEDLLKSNKSLAMAQKIGKIGTWDYDLLNEKIFWSDEVYVQFGLKAGSVEPSKELFISYVTPEQREIVNNAIRDAIEKETPFDMDINMLRNDGTSWISHITAALIKDKAGTYRHFIGIQQDITESELVTRELIVAKEKAEESNRLKSEFLANLSHEIRTPMNGIIGFASLLEQEVLNDDERNNFAHIIVNSSKQLLRIIDDILEISRLQTRQIKILNDKINLSDLLLELFSIFDLKAKNSGLHMYLKDKLQSGEEIVYTDASKLKKILSNLLENAFKFTKEGYVELGVKKQEKMYQFYVKDTGLGIRKEMQQIIFERFSQEEKEISQKSGGLGLGLSIAMENAQLLGGNIWLTSEKGKGSSFFVEIPLEPEETEEKDNDSSSKKGDIGAKDKPVVLVAEDEEVNYQYIEILLRKYAVPLEIHHVFNGKEAVEFCKNQNNISLVIMDIKMPLMNGIEATKLIKEIRPELPVIAQTAYTRNEDRELALAAGCEEYISKPFQRKHFYEVLSRYIS